MAMRQVVGAVGAVIGYVVGGPQGAQWGWTIGSMVGNIVDPQILRGPRIGELGQQTSQEGVPRPIVFALSPPMAGNIIATGQPEIVRRRRRQGKGGPTVETESIYRTYAIGICEGPITRVVKVWRNGELVFDDATEDEFNFYDRSRNDLIIEAIRRTETNNNNFLLRAQFYEGSYEQTPDPRLELIFGVGTTPSYRGTAYMMVRDDVTDLRGAIPQYMFQVERCEGYYLTSQPYAVESIDAMDSSGFLSRVPPAPIYEEAIDSGGSLVEGELRDILHIYDDGDPEAIDSEGSLLEGELRDILIIYSDADPEAIDSSGALLSGVLDEILIVYGDADPEAIDSNGSLISGSLT